MIKYVSIDIETTGLNPDTCQVLEFAAIIDDGGPIESLPRYRRLIGHDVICGEAYALNMNARLIEQLALGAERMRHDSLGADFAHFLSMNDINPLCVQVAGKNFASFDRDFITRLPCWSEYIKFNFRYIDPGMLYWDIANDKTLPNTDLCMHRAGIKGGTTHEALDDALIVVKLIRHKLNKST